MYYTNNVVFFFKNEPVQFEERKINKDAALIISALLTEMLIVNLHSELTCGIFQRAIFSHILGDIQLRQFNIGIGHQWVSNIPFEDQILRGMRN